jgi:hypothetical protein
MHQRAVHADELAAGARESVLRRVHQVPALVDPQPPAVDGEVERE